MGTAQFVATFKGKPIESISGGFLEITTQKILDLIASNPRISRTELAARTGISTDGVKYHIDRLRKQGVLKQVGADRGGCWEIVGESTG